MGDRDESEHEPGPTAVEELVALLDTFPTAPIDHDNLAYYQGLRAGELRIVQCRSCRAWHHPPGPRCPSCWSRDVAARAVDGRGTVELATVLHVGPAVAGIDYARGHHLVSVVLDDVPGVRVTAPIVGVAAEEPPTGRRVRHQVVARDGIPTLVFGLDERDGR